jgi:predicted enzyme related to lactoylglutathione lyase
MDLRDEIAELVRHAGGIFNGIWDTPRGRFATLTDPSTLSTALTPVAGISIASIQAALERVRTGF